MLLALLITPAYPLPSEQDVTEGTISDTHAEGEVCWEDYCAKDNQTDQDICQDNYILANESYLLVGGCWGYSFTPSGCECGSDGCIYQSGSSTCSFTCGYRGWNSTTHEIWSYGDIWIKSTRFY